MKKDRKRPAPRRAMQIAGIVRRCYENSKRHFRGCDAGYDGGAGCGFCGGDHSSFGRDVRRAEVRVCQKNINLG